MSTPNTSDHIEAESSPTLFRSPILFPNQLNAIVAQAKEPAEKATCPHCRAPYREGELACPKCGIVFSTKGKTNLVFAHPPNPEPVLCGDAIVEPNKTCFLEINGLDIQLPNQNTIVLGRSTTGDHSTQPDITLDVFDAAGLGVSRHHARITRHGNIFYIADMGSSNGTFLNGRLLLRNHNRLVHSGDELQLGHLKLRIKF